MNFTNSIQNSGFDLCLSQYFYWKNLGQYYWEGPFLDFSSFHCWQNLGNGHWKPDFLLCWRLWLKFQIFNCLRWLSFPGTRDSCLSIGLKHGLETSSRKSLTICRLQFHWGAFLWRFGPFSIGIKPIQYHGFAGPFRFQGVPIIQLGFGV